MLIVASDVKQKLLVKHGVTIEEVEQCFASMGKTLIDNREENKTTPPTRWFIGETDFGKQLKVVFIFDGKNFYLKTAYPPNSEEVRIYHKFC